GGAWGGAGGTEGVVLWVGLAGGGNLEVVLERARSAVELVCLPPPPSHRSVRLLEGALTDARLEEDPPAPGDCLVAEDFASVFLSADSRRRLEEDGISLAVRRPARLIAVTANPAAPGRAPLAAPAFFDALLRGLPGVPLVDVLADLGHAG